MSSDKELLALCGIGAQIPGVLAFVVLFEEGYEPVRVLIRVYAPYVWANMHWRSCPYDETA
jgi:hypothetical protein